MPPTTGARQPSSFVAVWVEDGRAVVQSIDVVTGAIDELARFNAEGISRIDLLELTRQMVRMRYGINAAPVAPRAAPVPSEPRKAVAAPTPAPVKKRKRAITRQSGETYTEMRERQARGQADLLARVRAHPEGVYARDLAREMELTDAMGVGVRLAVLRRKGLTRSEGAAPDMRWYAVADA